MDVKLNINLNSNLMSVGKSSAAASAANLNSGALNLKSGDRGACAARQICLAAQTRVKVAPMS